MIQLTVYLKKEIDSFKVEDTTYYPTYKKITANIESKDLHLWLQPEFKKIKIDL